MMVGLTGYALGLVALNTFYTEQSAHGKYWLFLLPVVPLIYIATTIIRVVLRLG